MAVMLIRRYGRLPVLFWSQVRETSWNSLSSPIICTGSFLWIPSWLYLCTKSENICWSVAYRGHWHSKPERVLTNEHVSAYEAMRCLTAFFGFASWPFPLTELTDDTLPTHRANPQVTV